MIDIEIHRAYSPHLGVWWDVKEYESAEDGATANAIAEKAIAEPGVKVVIVTYTKGDKA